MMLRKLRPQQCPWCIEERRPTAGSGTLLLAKETKQYAMRYQQLTEGLYQIACLRDHGLSQARIAKQIEVHPSTVSRELRRNRGEQGYRPAQWLT